MSAHEESGLFGDGDNASHSENKSVQAVQPASDVNTDHGQAAAQRRSVDELEEPDLFKVVIDGDDGGVFMRQVHRRLEAAVRIRDAYTKPVAQLSPDAFTTLPSRVTVVNEKGVFKVSHHDVKHYHPLPSWGEFAQDVQTLRLTVGNAKCISACTHRLGIIQERSRMFFLLNTEVEESHNLRRTSGVGANEVKVDVSVALSKCMDAQAFLGCIVETCTRQPETSVRLQDGASWSLRELLDHHGVSDPRSLTVGGLGWQPHATTHGSAETSCGTNPLSAALRYTFSHWKGSLSGSVLKRYLQRAEASTSATQAAEYAIPVYGAYANELPELAASLQASDLGPFTYIRWVLKVRLLAEPPAGYPAECQTVQDQLDNLFLPLLKATIAPTDPKNRALTEFMAQVGAMQMENLPDGPEQDFNADHILPEAVACHAKQNNLYYLYYVYANLTLLNSLRVRRGMAPWQLRCSANHFTGMDDLIGGFMVVDVITRATKLLSFPVLQYFCGLHHVGLAVSPLYDHLQCGVPYATNPLPHFLHRCLRVSVATEAPLLYHHNPNALAEEYATAQNIFRLSALDVAELAHNSVLISSFPEETKRLWLGETTQPPRGANGGDRWARSPVSAARLGFREESWQNERDMMRDMYMKRVNERGAGLGRWHYLSNVQEVEYNTVLDYRIRFPRTVLRGPHKELQSTLAAAPRVARALDMRAKYIWKPPNPWEPNRRRDVEADFQRKTETFNEDEWTYAASDAVFISYPRAAVHSWPRSLPTLNDYHRDMRALKDICASAEVKEFAHRRLENLDHKFRLHLALNHANEAGTTEERLSSNRDVYQATKVDTHIHMAAGMTPKQILQFILKKFAESKDDIAVKKGEEIITLGQLFTKAGITPNLTVDQLNVQADHTLFDRFDNFNSKYNPMGNGDLRSLMLKTDNFMNGRYFAELIRDVFSQYSRDRYTFAENRVSVYGINIKEWDKLAVWFTTHGMSSKHNKFIIQVPRVYKVFRGQNVIGSFGQYLQNIFQPLWEASLHPSEHPTVHNFLNHVSGFDSVDNEATIDLPFNPISPWAWTTVDNPPYSYYLYYLYANIRTLNEFRASRGFSTFALRPHCGESGSDEHLYGAFLCANGICHGINLRNDPPMQYLYYLTQIGLHVSPLSNNALFLRFLNNPFPDFFRRGLNVSLSTDDPMMFHQTQEPLIEEYSIAARVWGLSPNDLCEIARNSVLQCGFDYDFKREAIGDRWYMSSSLGNDPLRTHLSDIRVAFRFETYHTEMQLLDTCTNRPVVRYMLTTKEEREINEQNLDIGSEEILLSTHDQEVERLLRDMEAKQEAIHVAKGRVDALRRQQNSLVDRITDVGLRRQAQQEPQHNSLPTSPATFRYPRDGEAENGEQPFPPMQSAEGGTVQRMLQWRRQAPPQAPKYITELNLPSRRGRPLPSPQ